MDRPTCLVAPHRLFQAPDNNTNPALELACAQQRTQRREDIAPMEQSANQDALSAVVLDETIADAHWKKAQLVP
jgi:hypothetical protein